MRIGIDVRYLSHGLVGGIHTYLKCLIPVLLDRGRRHSFVLYADNKAPFELEDALLPANASVQTLPYHNGLSSLRHDLFMHRAMTRDGIEVAHFPANFGFGPRNAATVVTVHDALTLTPLTRMFGHKGSRRSVRSVLTTAYLHSISVSSVRKAKIILTVSEHARQDIAAHSSVGLDRIIAAPHAPGADMVHIENCAHLDEVRNRLQLPERFVLADALKNPSVLVRAWNRLPGELRAKWQIVFFSRQPNPLPVVFETVESGAARLLVRPSRADLVALYNLADIFVFPSWYEGFGIPIIEAMACGTPVIASDRYSIPEVAGEAALIMDAEDDAKLAEYLVRILTIPGEAEQLRSRGYRRAADFSWEHTADIVLDAYEKAFASLRVRA